MASIGAAEGMQVDQRWEPSPKQGIPTRKSCRLITEIVESGPSVRFRRTVPSGGPDLSFGTSSSPLCASSVPSTIFISYRAKAEPMQRRLPPPNGMNSKGE